MEDFASVISDLLKKWMGDNGWRFWLCTFIVLSIMWYIERNNYYGYGAIFSLLMTMLLLINFIYAFFKDRRQSKINRLIDQSEKDEKKREEESKTFEYKNNIWMVFDVVDKETLDSAVNILSLKEINKNPLVRFASYDDISKYSNLWSDIVKARQTFILDTNYGSRYDMINMKQTHLGYYLEFDPYLYTLLIHYKKTHERKFI